MDCRIKSGNDERKKGGETPAGACPMIRINGCGAPLEGEGARLSAFHRGACCSERTPQLSSSYALPGTWSERTIPMVRKIVRRSAGVTRSFLSQSSGLPRRPVMVPAGRIPRSRPGAAVTSRRPREPLSPRQPASPADVLYGSEIREKFVAEMGTNVKFHRIGDMQSPGDYWDRPSLFWGNLAWWPLCSRGHHHKQSFGRHAISAGTKYRVNAGEQSAFQRLKGSPVFTAFL